MKTLYEHFDWYKNRHSMESDSDSRLVKTLVVVFPELRDLDHAVVQMRKDGWKPGAAHMHNAEHGRKSMLSVSYRSFDGEKQTILQFQHINDVKDLDWMVEALLWILAKAKDGTE